MFESSQPPTTSMTAKVVAISLGGLALTAALIGAIFLRTPRSDLPTTIEPSLLAPLPPLDQVAPLTRLSLPGMSIEAPSVAVVNGDYVTGNVQARFPIEWTVTWQRGTQPPPEVMQRIVETMAKAIDGVQGSTSRVAGSREITVSGAPGRRYEIANERGGAIVTIVECGGRVVQILGGGSANARSIVDKMVESFRCTPDPTKDTDREAVAVEARPGWQRTLPTGAPMLVNARELLVRPTLLSGAPGVPIERYAPMSIRAAGFTVDTDTPVDRAGRKLWYGSLVLSGKPRKAAFLAWDCPNDTRAAAVYVVSMQGAPLDEGIALALTGRCLGPEERPPAYPVKGAR
ncbi:MAG: hypothetical protein ABI193_15145 [Minicystis sp.]